MRQLRLLALGLILGAGVVRADEGATASPLRLIPTEAELLLEIKNPLRLAQAFEQSQRVAELLALPAVKEQLEGTGYRRGRQLLAYFEKSLGGKWPELLDALAGGGLALGGKVGQNNGPALLVIQGKDEKRVEKFTQLLIEVLEGELARQESKDRVQKGDHHGISAYAVGSGFFLARAGAALVISNKKEAMGKALDLHLGKASGSLATHADVLASDKLLPPGLLARGWLNMRPVQASPQGKELYRTPRDNFALTLLFGSYLDILGRTPFLCAGLSEEKDGLQFTLRAAAGRDGMGADSALHLPAGKEPGSRPLLEPRGVLYSSSFHLDVAKTWTDRQKLFPPVQAKSLEEFDKTSGRFLAGVKMSTLLQAAGAYHRLVVVNQARRGYEKEPKTRLPAFAFISEMRDQEKFGRGMEAVLRAAALLATQQYDMNLDERKHNGHDIVGYRFNEKAEVKQDVDDVRFNFSPCFARVGKQFIFCSTMDLCKELVDLLVVEEKSGTKSVAARATERYYARGVAALLREQKDALIMQAILDRATPPAEASKQVDQFLALVEGLGRLVTQVSVGNNETRYDIRLRLGKR